VPQCKDIYFKQIYEALKSLMPFLWPLFSSKSGLEADQPGPEQLREWRVLLQEAPAALHHPSLAGQDARQHALQYTIGWYWLDPLEL
jgi:hypothetical protein